MPVLESRPGARVRVTSSIECATRYLRPACQLHRAVCPDLHGPNRQRDDLLERANSQTEVRNGGSNDAPEFVQYYLKESLSEATTARFERIKAKATKLWSAYNPGRDRPRTVCDIGCGAGSQVMIWARDGYDASGVDISPPLIGAAARRAQDLGVHADFKTGSATALPYKDAQFDIVLLAELLEHVPAWQDVLSEATRIIRPGGVLYLSTSNRLCPVQQEFDLPAYSWYPGWLKRRLVKKAITTHRHWVSHADFPAVNWFSFFELRRHLALLGYRSFDRFDMLDPTGMRARFVRAAIRASALLRFAGHVASPGLALYAVLGEAHARALPNDRIAGAE